LQGHGSRLLVDDAVPRSHGRDLRGRPQPPGRRAPGCPRPALFERPMTAPEALDALMTEQADPRYADLDQASVDELARLMNEADASVPAAIAASMGAIVPAIEAITDRLARGGRLRYVGAGTAGRMGVLDASECPPTFGTPPELVKGIIAGGPDAILAAQ